MLVKKICLTGGPGGGKSTVINRLKEELEIKGYRVFVIEEVATKLINKGIKPFGDNKIDLMDFERRVIEEQLYQERCHDLAIRNIWDGDIILICDRGIADINSYITDDEYVSLLKSKGLNKEDVLKSYNLVIHLQTAASGKKGYTLKNNPARSEDEKEAIKLDEKCLNSWKSHPNLKYVYSKDNFEDKIREVIDIVMDDLKDKRFTDCENLKNVYGNSYKKS